MRTLKILALVSFLSLTAIESNAQCAMCRRVAESSTEAKDNKVGRGLNTGILYLLVIPYILGGIGLYHYYKGKKQA